MTRIGPVTLPLPAGEAGVVLLLALALVALVVPLLVVPPLVALPLVVLPLVPWPPLPPRPPDELLVELCFGGDIVVSAPRLGFILAGVTG